MMPNKRIVAVVVMVVAVAAGSAAEKNVSVGAIISLNDLEGNRDVDRTVTALDVERQNKHVFARDKIGDRRHDTSIRGFAVKFNTRENQFKSVFTVAAR